MATRGPAFDIVVRGHRLHGQRWGASSGPLVIGVPGLAGTSEHLAFLGAQLRDQVQFVALDLRGRGRSEVTPVGTYGWEEHALDVLAVADSLGAARFSIVGSSMGGSVAMKAAELDGERLDAVVLVDIAGRVDRGIGPVIERVAARVGRVLTSTDAHVDEVRAQGLVEPWSGHWERAVRYDLQEVDGGVTTRTSATAVAEDRAYTAIQDPHDRWRHLTMPTLLIRATRELAPGSGFVVPAAERDRFVAAVPQARVVEVDGNHLTVTTSRDAAAAIDGFLAAATG